ncbi:MAG: hypothetical protein U0R64_02910 [Candidatus Nanopelagicales bacterium]
MGRRRRAWMQTLVVIVAMLGLVPVTHADASTVKWYGWGPSGHYRGPVYADCELTDQGLIYAHVYTRMWVRNTGHFSHWVGHFRIQARLVSTSPGLSPQSNWASVRKDSDKFLQDTKYNRAMDVYTINDPKSAYQDWDVKVKLIWERDLPFRDIVKKRTIHLAQGGCNPVAQA